MALSITLTADDGTRSEHQVKMGWDEVTVTEFAEYFANIATNKDSKAHQLYHAARLLTTIPTETLYANVRLCRQVLEMTPWLNTEPVPDSAITTMSFVHNHVTYLYRGNLSNISVGRYEGLLNTLQSAADAPMACLPMLVALLYVPSEFANDTNEPRQSTVDSTAAALADAPVTVVYQAVRFFFLSTASYHASSARYSKSLSEVKQIVQVFNHRLNRLVQAKDSTSFLSRLRTRVIRHLLRSVWKRLETC